MTANELATAIATAANRAAYAAATDKTIFVQNAIEALGVATYPASPLCDFVEDALNSPAIKLSGRIGGWQ